MSYLLDTCVLLWAMNGDMDKIGAMGPILEDATTPIHVSVVSAWEISIKKSLGKLSAPDDILDLIGEAGFFWLPVTLDHIRALETLPHHHNDPFDRLLIAQARSEKMKILTTDKRILQYGPTGIR